MNTISVKRAYVVSVTCCILNPAHADEGGVSFWLPGQQSNFAATPGEPGWSIPVVYYHTSSDAGLSREFVVGGNLVAGLEAQADLVFVAPTYTFAQPVMGGQGSFMLTVAGGHMRVDADATLTGPGGTPISVSRSDSLTGMADLYPTGTVKWSKGVHNSMAYVAGGIPVGSYKVGELANLGTNHWSIDGGGGYTYLDPKKGHEFSVVGGLTYNFENDDTNYQNGVDAHIDLAWSQFLNEAWHIGLVGYIYYQLSGDNGEGAILGDNKARVYAIGPQAGVFFPVGKSTGYISLRGYFEFGAEHRTEGWNGWLTLSIPVGSGA
jgi:hypothetical protein